jgi:hypothetical protein
MESVNDGEDPSTHACRADRSSRSQQSDELCVFVDAVAFGDERGAAVMRRAVYGLAVAVLMVTWRPTPVATAPPREAAAGTLAAQGKLFCHRTFRATSWIVATGFPSAYREADQDLTDATLCGIKADGARIVYSTIGGGAIPTVGTGPTGLPTLQISGQKGLTAVETLGAEESGLTGRVGWRWYTRWSNDNACEAAKYMQVGAYWTFNNSYLDGSLNGGMTWQGGAEPLVANVTSGQMRGKWWRTEGYIDNWQNPKSQTIFMKNITDNWPESTRTVTTLIGAQYLSNNVQYVHTYRDQRIWPGTCTNQYSYLLVGKNLGPTERLPPAAELEGGSGGGGTVAGSAPSAPTGLAVR